MTPYYKLSDANLLTWARHLSDIVSADGESLGVPASRVTALSDAVAAYAEAYGKAAAPMTRTRITVEEKNLSREALMPPIAAVAAVLDTDPNVSNAKLMELGLPPRRTRQRWQVPTETPCIQIRHRNAATVSIRVYPTVGSNAKPAETSGAMIYYCVGAEPVSALDEWTFARNSTRTTADIHFPSDLPAGTPVWITARWFNRTGAGPLARPIGTVLAGGGLMRAAA
jgi:hypothetical protein